MWIKIKYSNKLNSSITVPDGIFKDNPSNYKIKFGQKTLDIAVNYSKKIFNSDSSFENPILLLFSSEIKEKLYICENLIYRMNINDNTMEIGPVIGLLLGVHSHIYNSKHMKKYSDRLGVYNKIGGLIYAFSSNSINWEEKTAHGLFFNYSNSNWEFGKFPLPDVIYRRDFHQSPKIIDKLSEITCNKLFNSQRFTKLELYDFVKKDDYLSEKLPKTIAVDNFINLKSFIDENKKAILKPVDLSRGRGICIFEKIHDNYEITDYRTKKCNKITIEEKSLEDFFKSNQGFFDKYLIQKYIDLAKIEESLFDIRVVMQKITTGKWECSGIECRVSCPKILITNIAKGGYALSLDEALKLSFGEDCNVEPLENEILEYCINLCNHLDFIGKHFAELGLDIAFDINKKLWLIEANVFPSFHGFKKIDYGNYLKIRYTPLLYALSLTNFNEDNP